MLILSNTEYAIIINIIEYINTTSSPVVSILCIRVFYKKDLQFDLQSQAKRQENSRIFCRHKTCSLENLKKKKKITVHIIYCWRRFSGQTRYRGRKASSDYECLSYGSEIPNTSVCSDCSVHLHGEILGIRTCADVTRLSNICLLIYTLIYGPKTYLLQDRFMIIIIIQVSKVWINEHLCNFAT